MKKGLRIWMKDEKKFTYAKNQGNAMFVSYKMCSSVGVKRLRTYFLIDQFFSGKLIFLFNSSLESRRKKRKKNTCATASGLQFPNETGLYLSIFFVQNICTCAAKNKHHNYMHLSFVSWLFFLFTSWFSR